MDSFLDHKILAGLFAGLIKSVHAFFIQIKGNFSFFMQTKEDFFKLHSGCWSFFEFSFSPMGFYWWV